MFAFLYENNVEAHFFLKFPRADKMEKQVVIGI